MLSVSQLTFSLAAGGLEPDELLHELKQCGLNITDSENVELYKDGDYYDGLMIEHLRILLNPIYLRTCQSFRYPACIRIISGTGCSSPLYMMLIILPDMVL